MVVFRLLSRSPSLSLLKVRKMATVEQIENTQANLLYIRESLAQAGAESTLSKSPRLVAVSKTKPSDLVKACYVVGQRHFGENYIQELEQKAFELKDECPEIKWHYIGQIQSNKISKICSIPLLNCVETVESEKHCALFEKELSKKNCGLEIYIQVNTSSEPQKGGVSLEEAQSLARYVKEQCPHLKLSGFMTIGSIDGSQKTTNPDFDCLYAVRKEFCLSTGEQEDVYHLSMGMSDDYLTAIAQGSTSVRVGSKIFGPRIYTK